MIHFSVCPHDLSIGINRWKDFAKILEKNLGEEVTFSTPLSFREEIKRIERGDIDVYYTGPKFLKKFLEMGYKPVAKFKGQRDRFFLIAKGDIPEGEILVALPFLRPAGYALLGLDIENVRLIFTRDFYDAYLLLKEGKVHASIMYNETWEEIEEEERKNFKVIENYIFESSHMFVARPHLYERVKSALLALEGLEEVQEEVYNSIRFIEEFDRFIKFWSYLNIAKTLNKTPHIGILIYKDRVVYVNEGLLKITGYSREELIGAETIGIANELIPQHYREILGKAIERSISNPQEPSFYSELPLIKKDGTTLWVLAFADTILYQGEYHRTVLLIDITKRKRLEKLYSLLKSVNRIITGATLEEELFEKICRALTMEMGIRFVWVGVPDPESGSIKPLVYHGHEHGYLSELKISTRGDIPEGKGPTGVAYRENRIMINPDTRVAEITSPWREKMLHRGYLSSVAIPIKKGDKVAYILNLYASEPLFFEEETTSILEEIRSDIEFALNRMEELKQSMLALRALESSSWVMITDEEGRILYVNDSVSKISGYSKEELIGKKPNIFKSGYHSPSFYKELWENILSGKTFHSRFINKGKDRNIFHIEQTIYPLKLPDGTLRFISVGLDVTREAILSSELERLSLYDPVTGLFNNKTFYSKCKELLERDGLYFMILIDIYNFYLINKTYGIDFGDIVLREVGKKLIENMGNKGIVSRISSDTFGILFGPAKEEKEAIILVERLNRAFTGALSVDGNRIPISINIGVSIYPRDGSDVLELLEKANIALLEAKRRGEGEIRFFEQGMEERSERYLSASKLVERAINEKLFTFYYQPYYRAKNLKLAGFEALVRIKDKDGTIYSPAHFIDYLESSRFLREFELWAVTEAARKAEKWGKPISVNISAKTLETEELWEDLLKTCSKAPINIEITERALVESPGKLLNVHEKLKRCKNIKLALDDFGTGYSSLTELTNLPIDLLKIDISFIRGLARDEKRRIIVKNVINLSKDLGIKTIAEGVETKEELEILQKMGCTYLQGFLLSKPLPEEEVEKMLSEGS